MGSAGVAAGTMPNLRTRWVHRGNGPELWLRLAPTEGEGLRSLSVSSPDGTATVDHPLEHREDAASHVYDARLRLDELVAEAADPTGTWRLAVTMGVGGSLLVPPSDDGSEVYCVLADPEPLTVATVVQNGRLHLDVSRHAPWAEANVIELADDGIVLHGYVVGADGPEDGWVAILRNEASDELVVPVRRDGPRFEIELARASPSHGVWTVAVGPPGDHGGLLPLARLLDDIDRKDDVLLFPWHRVADRDVELQPSFGRDARVRIHARSTNAPPDAGSGAASTTPNENVPLESGQQRRPWSRRARQVVKRAARALLREHPLSLLMRAMFGVVAVAARWSRARRRRFATDADVVHLVLLNAFGMGGTIRTVTNLANALASRSTVRLVSVIQERDEPWFETVPAVAREVLVDRRQPMGWLAGLLAGRPSVLIPSSEPRSHRFSLLTDVALVRALWTLPRGVLLTTRPGLNLAAARYAPGRLTLVGQEHLMLSAHREPLRERIVRDYPLLDALTVLTSEDEREYRDNLAAQRLVLRHIPNAVPDIAFPRTDLSAKRVVAAGRFGPVKRFDLLVEAFAQVIEERPDWSLRLYGSGPTSDEVAELVRSKGLAEHIQLMGRTDHIWQEMAKASIFALSSSFEGFGMVLIEAFNCGLPVVSFACPRGPREIVEHEVNGLLVPEQDVDALASGLLRMIDDGELRKRCSAGALQHGRRYSMSEVAPRWHQLFADAVTG